MPVPCSLIRLKLRTHLACAPKTSSLQTLALMAPQSIVIRPAFFNTEHVRFWVGGKFLVLSGPHSDGKKKLNPCFDRSAYDQNLHAHSEEIWERTTASILKRA